MRQEKNKIMAHLVAGYPDIETSLRFAKTLIESGVSALEIQFPFSDPTADGPAIERACSLALENGFRVDDGFALVKKLSSLTDIPLFIMTYGSIAYTGGIGNFVEKAANAGSHGLIVPDLPFDYDEGLYALCRKSGLECVPVLVPSMAEERIEKIISLKSGFLYAALRSGTTGSKTLIDDSCRQFLEKLAGKGPKVMAGFGLRSREQIAQLEGLADFFIVGSALVAILEEITAASGDESCRKKMSLSAAGEYIKTLL